MLTTVTREQYFNAVAQLGGMDALYQSASADANSPVWIEFYSAKYVKKGDPLYVQTQLALGYTSAQMQILFDMAVSPMVIPSQYIRARDGMVILSRDGSVIESRAA